MVDIINFVREQRKRQTKQQQSDQKIFSYAVIFGVVAFGVFLLTLFVRGFLVLQVKGITDQQAEQITQIKSQEENEKSFVLFATKLQVLSELFTNRRNKQEAIKYFSTLFDNTVLINDIRYEADSSALTFGVQTKNIFSLHTAIDIMNSADVQSRFTSLTFDEISRGEGGEYQTKVNVVLKSDT